MKASEIREMSIADIRERIEIEQSNLDTMKINHTISPLEDTSYERCPFLPLRSLMYPLMER